MKWIPKQGKFFIKLLIKAFPITRLGINGSLTFQDLMKTLKRLSKKERRAVKIKTRKMTVERKKLKGA